MISSIDPKLVFELFRDEFGRYTARCLNAGIRSEGADLEELHGNVTAAIEAFYDGEELPRGEDIHFVMFTEDPATALV